MSIVILSNDGRTSTPPFLSDCAHTPKGACEGTLACSTCHMIVDPQWYPKIPDPITEEEHDMLDLAFGLTETYVLFFEAISSPPWKHLSG